MPIFGGQQDLGGDEGGSPGIITAPWNPPPVPSGIVAASGDLSFADDASDLRTIMPSGFLVLFDGTPGGIPLEGINAGLPTDGIIQWTVTPSGVEGDSLYGFLREFPRYTRIYRDRTSLGGQFLTAVSRLSDELLDAQTLFSRSRIPFTYPVYEQGVVYEWNFNEASGLQNSPAVIARIDDTWFELPVAQDEYTFWTSPPTRLETTTAEITGLTLLDWTQIGTSGLVTLISGLTELPLHNQIVVEVSGARYFSFQADTEQLQGMIYIYGNWPQCGYRPQPARVESMIVFANAPLTSRSMWRSIEKVEARGLDPNAYVRIKIMDFNAKWKSDYLGGFWTNERNSDPNRIFWQLVSATTAFSGIVQPEFRSLPTVSDRVFLARTRLLTDTIFDQDLEWDVPEAWGVTDASGIALSGIKDIVPVPDARFLMLLDSLSGVWVVDTYRPAINMHGFAESTACPVRIDISHPKDSSEMPGQYTLTLHPMIANTSDGVQRWRWAVHHHGSIDIIAANDVVYPYHHLSGWQSGYDDTVRIPDQHYIVSGAGQYIFELALVTDSQVNHQTYMGFQQIEKQALGRLPIRGLNQAPSGIEFDSLGRPWVFASGHAVRCIMRTDVGIWIPDERVLVTRESYDEVRLA